MKVEVTKEWCMNMAALEGNAEIGAGAAQPARCLGLSSTGTRACCDRAGEYNGFASGPLVFVCPEHCACHD